MRRGVRECAIVLALLGLTIAVRLAAFFHVVIDWDESLYALVARAMLHGGWPYVAVWENKPPLLFLIFAAFFKAFGVGIVAVRLAADAAVAASAYLLYRLGLRFAEGGPLVGMAAALLYLCATTNDGGLASNAEIFAAPLTCGGLLAATSSRRERAPMPLGRAALLGLWLGLSMQIKLTAVPEAVAIAAIACLFWRIDWLGLLVIALLALVPFAAGSLTFGLAGHLAAYVDAVFLGDVRRLSEWSTGPTAAQTFVGQLGQLRALALFAPLAALAAAFGGEPDERLRRLVAAALVWWAADALIVSATNEFEGHQFVTLMGPMALLAAYGIFWLTQRLPRSGASAIVVVAACCAVSAGPSVASAAALVWHRTVMGDPQWGDPEAQFACVLGARMKGDRSLFVMHQQPVLYLLTGSMLPTRYGYPPFLETRYFERIAGIDGAAEARRILATRPHFIATSIYVFDVGSRTVQAYNARLYPAYRLVYTRDGNVIYQLRPPARTRAAPRHVPNRR